MEIQIIIFGFRQNSIRDLNPKPSGMAEMSDELHEKITAHSEAGDELADQGDYAGALSEYWKAFDLIPEPKTDWDASTWVLTAIGDANFKGGDFKAGVDNLSSAMHCPDAIGNPFIHLRLGQCQFETGNLDRAADELTRAYALEGEEMFSEDDPKYFEFLKTRIQIAPPKKPWWKF